MNPEIPTRPCFACGEYTNETHSVHGVGHYECFVAAARSDVAATKILMRADAAIDKLNAALNSEAPCQ